MRIKVCSLILFFFGCYNNFLADSLLIQVKVVDDCIEAKILNNKIKGVKFYRGNLKKDMLSEEKEIKDVSGNKISFEKDDSKWVTIYIEDTKDFKLASLMECCKDLEIVLIDEDTLKIPRTFFSGLNDSFYGCENLKICSLKSIIDSYMKNFFSFKFKCAFEKCEKLRYVNFENMQENIGLWLTPGLLLRPFRGCNNLIAIFVNKDANDFLFKMAPNGDVYFLCYKGAKDTLTKKVGKKYHSRIIEVDNQEQVLNFFIANKDMGKEELRKKFQDTFVK